MKIFNLLVKRLCIELGNHSLFCSRQVDL